MSTRRRKSIFISYRSLDRAKVTQLAQDLTAIGDYDVWFDSRLIGGQDWWDAILAALESADIVIAAVSSKMLESEPCRLEREYARQLGIPIIPVQIEAGLNLATLPESFARVQIVPYHENKSDLPGLKTALENAPARVAPISAPKRPPPPISKLALIRDLLNEPALSYQIQKEIVSELNWYRAEHPAEASEVDTLFARLYSRPDIARTILDAAPRTPQTRSKSRLYRVVAGMVVLVLIVVATVLLASNVMNPSITPMATAAALLPTVGTEETTIRTTQPTLAATESDAAAETPTDRPITAAVVSGEAMSELIYEGPDGLVLLVISPADLRTITLRTTRTPTPIALVDDFDILSLNSGGLPAGTCLRYLRASADAPPLPRDCDPNQTYRVPLADADVFWWSDASASTLDVAVLHDGAMITVCPANGSCEFRF